MLTMQMLENLVEKNIIVNTIKSDKTEIKIGFTGDFFGKSG